LLLAKLSTSWGTSLGVAHSTLGESSSLVGNTFSRANWLDLAGNNIATLLADTKSNLSLLDASTSSACCTANNTLRLTYNQTILVVPHVASLVTFLGAVSSTFWNQFTGTCLLYILLEFETTLDSAILLCLTFLTACCSAILHTEVLRGITSNTATNFLIVTLVLGT